MKAYAWEFKYRAFIFGAIFLAGFSMAAFSPRSTASLFAGWAAESRAWDRADAFKGLLLTAAVVLVVAALIRTWASSYLQANVVYAATVKSDALVADGPYRWVRNPLYDANVLLTLGIGPLMCPLGFALTVFLMWVYCHRLILREESELLHSQGAGYARYLQAVPRLLPALWPRTTASLQRPRWTSGLKAEIWYWGFPFTMFFMALR